MNSQFTSDGRPKRAPLFLRLVTPLWHETAHEPILPATSQATFVLSTGRTGTVYLADLMDQLKEITSVHEPKPSRVLNAWTTAYLEGHVADSSMAAALVAKRRQSLTGLRTSRYIESNNFIAGFADALQAVAADPIVIHIIRDPRDFVTSLTNRGDAAGIRDLFNRYVPYWAYVPTGVRKGDLTPLTRAAYRWVAINHYLDNYGQRNPERYHRFRFEDIFDKQNPAELRRLLSAAGLTKKQIDQLDFAVQPRHDTNKFSLLDRPSSSANASQHQVMAKWRDWDNTQKQALARICGPLMKTYDYGNEPEWLRAL